MTHESRRKHFRMPDPIQSGAEGERCLREWLADQIEDNLLNPFYKGTPEHEQTRGHAAAYQRVLDFLDATGEFAPETPPSDPIQSDAEGERRCWTCGDTRVIGTGECRVAMSGPTCANPDCPPCQTPETEPCPDCRPETPPSDPIQSSAERKGSQ